MKIGITCYPTFGGSGVLATELGKQLALNGHEIHFISYALPYRLKGFYTNVYFHEVRVSDYPLFQYQPYTLSLAVKMYDVIQEYGLDLLHVHYAIPHATSAFIANQMLGGNEHPVKIVTTLHGTDITLVGQEASFKSITKFSIEQSDGVTAVSDFLKNQTVDVFGVKRDIEVIHNFVDTERFRPGAGADCCKKAIAHEDEKIIMHISNMRPVKRLRDVIEVFARVHKEVKSRLVLIGDGPDRNVAHQRAVELGIEKSCCFLGAQDSIESIISCADIALQPSESESFGISILEALSCGVPVIATRCGGPEEVMIQGETGYLSDVGNVDDMAANAIRLLTDDEHYRYCSGQARKRAVENYQIDKITAQYENFYESILKKAVLTV